MKFRSVIWANKKRALALRQEHFLVWVTMILNGVKQHCNMWDFYTAWGITRKSVY